MQEWQYCCKFDVFKHKLDQFCLHQDNTYVYIEVTVIRDSLELIIVLKI